MNSKRKKINKINKILDGLIDSGKFKNPYIVGEKILDLSKGELTLAEILVKLILLIDSDKESDILEALNSVSTLELPSTLELLTRTALMSMAICWIMLGMIYYDDVLWFRWIVVLGVVLLASLKIKNKMSLEQEFYQLMIPLLPNLGLLIFQSDISKLVAEKPLLFFFVFTLSNSVLSTMFMFLTDKASSD